MSYVAIDAPFWNDELILEDLLTGPPSWAGALQGLSEADDVAILDGFEAFGSFCDVMEVVAPLIAAIGPTACTMIDDKTDRRNCEKVAAVSGGSALAILAAAGCGDSTPSSTTDPSDASSAEIELARERARLELERQRAKERRNTLILAGGGIVAAGIAAAIALR